MPALEVLDLWANRLRHVPEQPLTLLRLRRLDLRWNQIGSVRETVKAFGAWGGQLLM